MAVTLERHTLSGGRKTMTIKHAAALAAAALGLALVARAATDDAGPAPTPAPAQPAASPEASKPASSPAPRAQEPARVVVQHILVSFSGKLPGKTINRTQDEARQLAGEI